MFCERGPDPTPEVDQRRKWPLARRLRIDGRTQRRPKGKKTTGTPFGEGERPIGVQRAGPNGREHAPLLLPNALRETPTLEVKTDMNILDMIAVPTSSAHAAHLPTPARSARAKRRALSDVNANLPTRTPRRRPDSTAGKSTRRKKANHAIYTPLVDNESADVKADVERRNESQTDGSSGIEILSTSAVNGVSVTTETDGKRFDSAIELPSRRGSRTVVEDREPVLMINELLQLKKSVILNFGPSNTVGEERSLPFRIETAHSPGAETWIKFEHIPYGAGIGLKEDGHDGEPPNASFRMRQGESKLFYVTWTPVLAGQLHEEIRLETNTDEHLCVVVLGVAKSPISDDRQFETAESPSSFTDRDNITHTAKQWEEIQCGSFSNWLNELFQSRSPDMAIELSDHQIAEEWTSAVSVFDSPDMREVRSVIEREVTEGRLAITPRSTRNVLDEVYVREQLTKLLLSYTPRWLHLGLVILLGDTIFKVGVGCPLL